MFVWLLSKDVNTLYHRSPLHLPTSTLLFLLVTFSGASRGVGAAIACAFAREGAKLHLVCGPTTSDDIKDVQQRCKSEGCNGCECHICDLTDPRKCDELCNKLGGIDVLVNNAGEFGPSGEEQGPIKGNPDEWERVIKINLNVPMRLTRLLAPKMCDKGDGYIINIGDVEGIHSGPKHPVYAASKHGLRGFTLSSYEALRGKGVHVVLVSPGNVAGTAMEAATDKQGGQGSIRPEDVAEACLFAFRVSHNCVPSEIVLKAIESHGHP